jgi:hypothetical protein
MVEGGQQANRRTAYRIGFAVAADQRLFRPKVGAHAGGDAVVPVVADIAVHEQRDVVAGDEA